MACSPQSGWKRWKLILHSLCFMASQFFSCFELQSDLSFFFLFFSLPAKFETDLFRKTDTVLLCFSLLLWVAGYWASMTKQLWLRSFHPSVLPSLKAEKYDLSLELYVWLKCQRLGSGKLGDKLLKTVLYPNSFFTMNKFLDTECVEGCLIKERSSSLQLNSAFWARK